MKKRIGKSWEIVRNQISELESQTPKWLPSNHCKTTALIYLKCGVNYCEIVI